MHTGRTALVDVGEALGDVVVPWPDADPRRAAHLAVYNSASHVMQAVTADAPQAGAAWLPGADPSGPAPVGRRLGRDAGPGGAGTT